MAARNRTSMRVQGANGGALKTATSENLFISDLLKQNGAKMESEVKILDRDNLNKSVALNTRELYECAI